jgi:DNA-directed RNA polymerase subunit L
MTYFNNTITFNSIPDHRHIEINKQHYEIVSLLKWVMAKKTIPHSRKTLCNNDVTSLIKKGIDAMMYELDHPQRPGEVRNRRLTLNMKRDKASTRLKRLIKK